MKTSTCIFLTTLLAAEIPLVLPMASMRYGMNQVTLKERIEDIQNGRDRHLEEWPSSFDSTVIRKDTHDANLTVGVKDDVYRIAGVTRAGVDGGGGWRNEGIARSFHPCDGEVVFSGEFRLPRTGESGVVFLGVGGACMMRSWGRVPVPTGNRYVIQTQAEKEQGKLFRLVKGSMSKSFTETDTARYTTLRLVISRDLHYATYFVNNQLLGELFFKERIRIGRSVTLALQTPQVNRYQEIYFRNLTVTCNGQTVLLREDVPANQRLFDFSTQTFCGLKMGSDIATAIAVFGTPEMIDSAVLARSAERQGKRYVFRDIEVYCVNDRIDGITSDDNWIVTNRGLCKGDSAERLFALYGPPIDTHTNGTVLTYQNGGVVFTAILRDKKVDRFELTSSPRGEANPATINDEPGDQRVFDFCTQSFCGFALGSDVSAAESILGTAENADTTVSRGYVGRYDKRLVFGDVEVYCINNVTANIITSASQIVTNRGLRKGHSEERLLALYGEPNEIINDGTGYLYMLGQLNFVVTIRYNRVDCFELFGAI